MPSFRRVVTALLCTSCSLPLSAAIATDIKTKFSTEDLYAALKDIESSSTSSRVVDGSSETDSPSIESPSPSSAGVVRFGDTLDSIAARYQLSVDQLIQFNPDLQNSALVVGRQLRLQPLPTPRVRSLISLKPNSSGGVSWPETPNYPSEFNKPAGINRWLWPAKGLFTSGYGWRWGRMHKGIDIANSVGTPILAAQDGRVTFSGWHSGGYGYLVEITHRDGFRSLYAHQSRLYVQLGDVVTQGQQIGQMGSTGRSTGPHLHFEIHSPGYGAVNPIEVLQSAA